MRTLYIHLQTLLFHTFMYMSSCTFESFGWVCSRSPHYMLYICRASDSNKVVQPSSSRDIAISRQSKEKSTKPKPYTNQTNNSPGQNKNIQAVIYRECFNRSFAEKCVAIAVRGLVMNAVETIESIDRPS